MFFSCLSWHFTGHCWTVGVLHPRLAAAETGFLHFLTCHIRSLSFVSVPNTHIHKLAVPPPSGATRNEIQQRNCRGLMWDCWVTLEAFQIGLQDQPALYCEEESICLAEWVLNSSVEGWLCCRPPDLPVGANCRIPLWKIHSKGMPLMILTREMNEISVIHG